MLCIIMVVLLYLIAMSVALRSFFMKMLEKSPWYDLVILFFGSLLLIPLLVVAIAGVIYFVCKGVIDFIFDAWKDFTVDVELVDSPA